MGCLPSEETKASGESDPDFVTELGIGVEEDMEKVEGTLFPDEDNVALGDLKFPELDEKEESDDERAVEIL